MLLLHTVKCDYKSASNLPDLTLGRKKKAYD